MLKCSKGFTLIELIVVMVVFMAVIMISAQSFNTILSQMTKITKSEESNIEGLVGLEMFRHDIQQAGYGLPYSYQNPISYLEAGYQPALTYNDAATATKVPRAIVAGNDIGTVAASDGSETYNLLASTDYLALKAASLGLSDASRKWTYMPYSSALTGRLKPRIWSSGNLKSGGTADRVIVIRRRFNADSYVNELVFNSSDPTIYWAAYDQTGFADAAFNPALPQDIHYVYGIKNGDPLGMPFNRADYFVGDPVTAPKPTFCAPATGILYKAVVNHSTTNPGGRSTYIPLLDCVADMQVVFGWDLDDGQGNEGQDGILDTYSTPTGTGFTYWPSDANHQTWLNNAFSNPDKLRNGLKVIKVSILAQVGRKDPNYQSPPSYVLGDAAADGITKTHTLTAQQRNYHWKVYRIVVRPKNLLANQ